MQALPPLLMEQPLRSRKYASGTAVARRYPSHHRSEWGSAPNLAPFGGFHSMQTRFHTSHDSRAEWELNNDLGVIRLLCSGFLASGRGTRDVDPELVADNRGDVGPYVASGRLQPRELVRLR